MSSRDEILARVRKNQPAAQPLPAVPTFDRDLASPVETFKGNLARMGGAFLDAPAGGNLDALIRKNSPTPRSSARVPRKLQETGRLTRSGNRRSSRTSTWASCERGSASRKPARSF